MPNKILSFLLLTILVSCFGKSGNQKELNNKENLKTAVTKTIIANYDTGVATAHIFVALCDNKYQGIIPVPPLIGNGTDLNNNLYWGCTFGIRSYFKQTGNWVLLKKYAIDIIKLERLIFKNKNNNFYLICDAYNGKYIKQCTIDFLNACSGSFKDTVAVDHHVLGINGNAELLTYIGHDGLMDFKLNQHFYSVDNHPRDVVILACRSKMFFSGYMQEAKARPLLWTTDLMCPEAYTIHDLLNVYIKNKNDLKNMNLAAANAYAKHQKCSVKSAQNLLVTGF